MKTRFLLILTIFMSSIIFGNNELSDKDKEYLENFFKELKKQCCLIVAEDSVEYIEVYASHFGFDKLKYKMKIRDFCKEMLEEEYLHQIIVEICEVEKEKDKDQYKVIKCVSILELKFEDNKNEIKKRYLKEKNLPDPTRYLDTDKLKEALQNNIIVDKSKKYRLKKYYIFDPLYEADERFQKQKINRKDLLILGYEKKIEYVGWKTLQKVYVNKYVTVKVVQ